MTDDDSVLAELRRIAGDVDGVPDLVGETARAAFATRRLDDELAELLQDSALVGTAAIRGAQAGPRMLSFEAGDVSLELQLEQARDTLVLRGLAVGTAGDVEIETASTGVRVVAVDDAGWFRADSLPVEPVRVRARAATGPTITTGWIRP